MEKLAQIPIGSRFGSPFGTTRGFADLVSIILSNAVAIAAILLLILIIIGGFFLISGAGSGNKESVAKGRTAVTAAVAGFLVIFVSYWIVVILESVFGFNIRNPNP